MLRSHHYYARTTAIVVLLLLIFQVSFPHITVVAEAAENYGPKIGYISDANKPEFYGTVEITVPANTIVDLKHDARFRIFARDNEDGDMTQQITMTTETSALKDGGAVPAGEHSVTYSVTDSDNNTSTMEVKIHAQANCEKYKIKKRMYTLPSVKHLNDLGFTRGNNHDRQIVGVFLDAGGTIEMRKVSGAENNGLIVSLYNNNTRTEPSGDYNNKVTSGLKNVNDPAGDEGWIEVTNEFVQKNFESYNTALTNSKQSVITEDEYKKLLVATPTVRTLYDVGDTPVEYEVRWDANNENVKPLHYYHQGDGQEAQDKFFKEWKEDEGSYAVVDGWSVMTLCTYEDVDQILYKDDANHNKMCKTLDEWFKYIDGVTAAYDELIGLSYSPEYYWDQNVKTKYFVRANSNGGGAAYYGGDCIGNTKSCVWPTFNRSWGMLHEIGHGYQGQVGNNTGLYKLTEVGVNFFSYYIDKYRVDDIVGIGGPDNWLLKAKNEESFNQRRDLIFDDYAKPENVGVSAMLYVFVNLLDYFEGLEPTGDYHDGYIEAYSYINKYYRDTYYRTGVKLTTLDAWTLALAEKYNVDVTEYFETWQIHVSDEVKDKIKMMDLQPLYYAKDLVGSESTSLKEKLDNIGEYDVVSREELKDTNLTGNVSLTFDIDDIEHIKGRNLVISDGTDEGTKRIEVKGEEPVTLNLPVGVYKVALPKPDAPYMYENCYVLVKKDETTNYKLTYSPMTPFDSGFDTVIKSTGYWGNDKVPFTLYLKGDKFMIDYQGTMLKNGGTDANTLFASITIKDSSGTEKYKKEVNGGNNMWINTNYSTETEDAALGDTVEIYYKGDKSDISVTDALTGQTTSYDANKWKDGKLVFEVTKYGLVLKDEADSESELAMKFYNELKDYLDKLMSEKDTDDLLNPFASPGEYSAVIASISKLEESNLADEFNDIIKAMTTGESPVITFGHETYSFEKGKFDLNSIKSEVTIKDAEDGDIPVENATVSSTVNDGTPGEYKVTVSVTDKHGNTAEKSVNVTITEPENNGGNETPGNVSPGIDNGNNGGDAHINGGDAGDPPSGGGNDMTGAAGGYTGTDAEDPGYAGDGNGQKDTPESAGATEAKTGDEGTIYLFCLTFVLAACALTVCVIMQIYSRKRNRRY